MSADKGKVHKNHVQFGKDVKTEPKIRAISPAPPPHEVTAPPPALPFAIKDEVELLRSGTLNKHGDRVKSQGASAENAK
ncbi:hypothetical protein TELCIR_04066 [Teladorsagia circumcincta]|uniref:Uncharacterized protein n=1 Tax=Teladorsagia circumcincta TaxID=45464 RepID=A0A2G9UUL3_TELCI|nr:hypothetical protein TELCIR_04066 [Teladorsagia circumcincta]